MLTAGTGPDADLDTATAPDEALVRLAGRGDPVAHAELWLRHGSAARAAVRRVAGEVDPDVVVQAVFARAELALRRGLPATVPFRLHLYETVREVAPERAVPSQAGSGVPDPRVPDPRVPDLCVPDPRVPRPGDARATEPAPGQAPLARAFRSLPALWRSTLWYLDAERAPAPSVALWVGVPLVDLAVVARAARAALRRSWVHAQACAWGTETACATTAVRISRYLRGQLRTEQKKSLETHLAGCHRCSIVLAEYPDVAQRLELVLLPGVLGAGTDERDDTGPGDPPHPGPGVPAGPAAADAPVLRDAAPDVLVPGSPHRACRRPRRRRRGGGEDSLGSCARRRCP
jgi:hypothetical protein